MGYRVILRGWSWSGGSWSGESGNAEFGISWIGLCEITISEWGFLQVFRTRRTCVELVVELVVFYVVLVELVENKDLLHKSL